MAHALVAASVATVIAASHPHRHGAFIGLILLVLIIGGGAYFLGTRRRRHPKPPPPGADEERWGR